MRRERGMTLIEIMLVLVMAGLIIIMGIRQYFSFREDANVTLVKSNTDALFAAMGLYFQRNCAGSNGTLSPYNSANTSSPTFFTAPRAIDINNELITPGYMAARQLLSVSVVLEDASVAPPLRQVAAYKARFVPYLVDKQQFAQDIYNPSVRYSYGATSKFLIWIPEVMVLIRDTKPDNMLKLRNMTGAKDCVDTNWVTDATCTSAPAIRFSRMVSSSNQRSNSSSYWPMLPNLAQMREQESNYGPFAVLSIGGTGQQYLVCEG